MLSKHSKLAFPCGNNVITSNTVIRYLGVDLEHCRSRGRSRKLLTSALILCHFDYVQPGIAAQKKL